MASYTTTTTRGGAKYDDLCKGVEKNYSFNLVCLTKGPNKEPMSFMEATETLKNQIKQSIRDIETQNMDGRKIESYVIGKSQVHRQGKAGSGFIRFDSMNRNTWKFGEAGVNKRWSSYYKAEHFDGLVVLAAIPRSSVPQNILDKFEMMNQEQYALALEQYLIKYFMLVSVDGRIINKTFQVGCIAKSPSYAGVLYFAYKLSEDPKKRHKPTSSKAKYETPEEVETMEDKMTRYLGYENPGPCRAMKTQAEETKYAPKKSRKRDEQPDTTKLGGDVGPKAKRAKYRKK